MEQPSPVRVFDGLAIPAPGTYNLDPAHTFVMFEAQHLVVGRVRGRFNLTTGRIVVTDEPLQSSVDVRIETASVDTQNAARDEDLRSERFLDAEKHPAITFVGSRAQPSLDSVWIVDGSLTVRGVMLPMVLTSRFLGAVLDPPGTPRVAFQAHAALSRSAFGLMADLTKETGGVLLRADVQIEINAEATLAGSSGG